MHKSKKTADYDVIHEEGGNRYRFFCDISGALLCTTEPFSADTTEAELMLAWKSMGVEHFNLCHKCGKWVMDAMYNADVLECVDCAPWEDPPRFCLNCGSNVKASESRCEKCGAQLRYGGGF